VHDRTLSAAAERNLARIGFRERNQLADVFRRKRGMHDDHQRPARNEHDGRVIDERIELDRIQARINRPARRDQRERIAVGRRAHARFVADRAARAAAVLDDHLLADALADLLSDDARDQVRPAARRRAHDDADRPRRILLRPGVDR
jgi:hypothetical protein